LSVPFI